jgi:hypothetical protein
MDLSESTIWRNYGKEENFFYHMLCQCPPWQLEPVDFRSTTVKKVLALALKTRIFERHSDIRNAKQTQQWSVCLLGIIRCYLFLSQCTALVWNKCHLMKNK